MIQFNEIVKVILFIVFIIYIWACKSVNNEDETAIEESEQPFYWSIDWHPKEDKIIVGGTYDSLKLISTDDFTLIKSYPYKGTITKTKWHPTKNKLAISVQDGISRPSILNLDTDEFIELDSVTMYGARAIGWNHSGALLAVGDYEGYLTIFDESGMILKKVNTNQKSIIGLDWHPDENLLVLVGEKITMYHYDLDRQIHIEDRNEEILMLCVAWHPNGTFFVTGDYGDFIHHYPPLLQYWAYNGDRIKSIEESAAEYRNLKWSSNGDLLATASEKIRLWDKNGNLVADAPTEDLLWGIDWKNDASQSVATDDKGKIIFWDSTLNKINVLQE